MRCRIISFSNVPLFSEQQFVKVKNMQLKYLVLNILHTHIIYFHMRKPGNAL